MIQWIRVRIKATGQVIDMVPDRARALIGIGTADAVNEDEAKKLETPGPEAATIAPAQERAVAPAQNKTKKKLGPKVKSA